MHRWFHVQEPTGGFRAHTTPPERLSNITVLVQLSNIITLPPPTLPHPELIRNQQETVMCIKERSGTKHCFCTGSIYYVHYMALLISYLFPTKACMGGRGREQVHKVTLRTSCTCSLPPPPEQLTVARSLLRSGQKVLPFLKKCRPKFGYQFFCHIIFSLATFKFLAKISATWQQ